MSRREHKSLKEVKGSEINRGGESGRRFKVSKGMDGEPGENWAFRDLNGRRT